MPGRRRRPTISASTATTRTAGPTTPPPATRPSRAVVEPVSPLVDGGTFAAKASIGAPVEVVADVFTDGHDRVGAALRSRPLDGTWSEIPMRTLGNDRFTARFEPDRLGPWQYQVVGWVDHFSSWRHKVLVEAAAGQDVSVDLRIGLGQLDRMIEASTGDDARILVRTRNAVAREDLDALNEPVLDTVVWRRQRREPTVTSAVLPVHVDRERARFSAWYEFFPRSLVVGAEPGSDPHIDEAGSAVDGDGRHGSLADAIGRLDHIAAMGFDVVYLPPIHPIGRTKRKGPDNSVEAGPDDPGSPWGIGGAGGGHTAVHPQLGTVDDVADLAAACTERDMELALDIAFQCSPDHPWVAEHPAWFAHRPDGTIQYAENPPKRYQDIYPLDFESDDWAALWVALRDVFLFWMDRGVRVFRVDNPHTKAFAFWEWAIATIRAEHPDVVFLSEAFTRPRVMQRLAKIGFTQSYTYFTWRQSSWDLRDYFEELAHDTVDFLRPNAWPNTPDILTEQLQHGGRAAFVSRAILAATLSPSWGVYGPAFELQEHEPLRPGSEEYRHSEKYEIRQWDLDQPHSLAPLLTRLNRIRRSHRPFRHLRTLRFHDTDNPALLAFSKTDPTGRDDPALVVANLDPAASQSGTVDIDWAALDLPYESEYDLVDHLGGGTHRWRGARNWVSLSPWGLSAHVFTARLAEGRHG